MMNVILFVKLLLKYVTRFILFIIEQVIVIFHIALIYLILNAEIEVPIVDDITIGKRIKISTNHYILKNNYLKKNEFGIWEMYIEGDPYERGLIYGELSKELIQRQEDIFVSQINDFVPSNFAQQFLRLFIGMFISDLPKNIPLENQQEIYGISKSFSSRYDYIASKYTRILNYHAAHDIGHALNDYSMVGCTSFALKNEMTADSNLMIGRNFDFYVGDEFANDKLLLFVNPTKGYSFASYSWAGFTGIASGLNEKGISVTINASKSDLPTGAKMPISILAREILQYASTIDEAIAIAKKRNTFVSETLMIGSAIDKKAILIEKSPTKVGVYDSNQSKLVCSNHYQSSTFIKDKVNILNIKESDSKFRFNRVEELLANRTKFTPTSVLTILRDQYGFKNDTLGMGNPRAINQLIAHHSVIILPESYMFYVSTTNYQLGEFIGFDLKKTFALKKGTITDKLKSSTFLFSTEYKQFKAFKATKKRISQYVILGRELTLTATEIKDFINNNKESYVTFEMLGKYYLKKKNYNAAHKMFTIALTKNLASLNIKKDLENLIQDCQNKKK